MKVVGDKPDRRVTLKLFLLRVSHHLFNIVVRASTPLKKDG